MAPNVTITLPDGSEREYPTGVTGGEVAASIGRGLAKAALGATVDGEAYDLGRPIDHDAAVAIVTGPSDEGREMLRHSTAHLMAQAVFDLFPGAKYAIGPAIADGFYYDFELPNGQHFTDDDLGRIEARMREIVKEDQAFVRAEYGADEGLALFADQPFKVEIIRNVTSGSVEEGDADEVTGDGTVGVYSNVRGDGSTAYVDLCRGPHVPSTGKLGAFKLMRVAGAYWRGDEKRPQLQRIYGTAWESKDALAAHLHRLEEAEKRDHRKLGVELDLFSFPDEIGSGLAVFHPKGGTVRMLMEEYSRERHVAAGYEFVNSPHITKSHLFEISGHLDWFADGMYPPMELDGGTEYYLKPMNCPFHILIFRSRTRSYRELPLRLFEFGTVYRYEKSGVVHGLTRVRGMTQDDAHIFCSKEQAPAELASLLRFVLDVLRDYGLDDFYLELSTKPEGKAVGTDEEWDEATEVLRVVATEANLELVMDPGGGAFYGPKISVQARDAIGRTWQMSTIQVDFQLPQRFDLHYVGADNERHRPIMIHRALFGSVERFFAVLLEHYAGAFPTWLAPVQVAVLPVADRHHDYSWEVEKRLREEKLRVEVLDAHNDTLGNRVRRAKTDKIPYVLVVGDDDVTHGTVGVNARGGEAPERGVGLEEFVGRITSEVHERRRAPARPTIAEGATSGPARRVRSGEAMSLDRLWAGWRSSYIEGIEPAGDGPPRPEGCLFGGLLALPDGEAMILERSPHSFTVMNAYPYTSGHVMVAPIRHVHSITELDAEEAAALMHATQRATDTLERVYRPEGLNVGVNIGRAAGAGVPGHVHVHVLPRWNGDTNFMTAVAETRVLPESLRHSYEKLRAAWS